MMRKKRKSRTTTRRHQHPKSRRRLHPRTTRMLKLFLKMRTRRRKMKIDHPEWTFFFHDSFAIDKIKATIWVQYNGTGGNDG